MRKVLAISAVVLVVLVVALDRIGLWVAESQIASRVQRSQGLDSHPDATIKGFPFLNQVLRGRYNEVDVTVHNVTRNGLTVDRVSVYAHGVSIPLGNVLSGSVKEVPVERADARVLLGFANLNRYLSTRVDGVLTVSHTGNNKLTLTGTLPLPQRPTLSVTARIAVSGEAITLSPGALDDVLAGIPGSSAVKGLVQRFFTARLPISQLPFGIRLQSAMVTDQGIAIAASATGLTLRAPSG